MTNAGSCAARLLCVTRRAVLDPIRRYLRALTPRSLEGVAPGLSAVVHGRGSVRPDLIAGLTVGAVAVPASLAMSELAGLPVVFGMYATFLPLAVYGLLGSSRQHVIGPDATVAALTAVTIAPMATVDGRVDPALYAMLAAALALAMGAVLFLAGLLHLGFVGDFFGKPVLLGYINGVAVIVISGQIEKLLGLDVAANDFVPTVKEIVVEVGSANGPTVALSIVLLAVAFAVKRFLPMIPPSLVVLGLGLAIAAVVDLGSRDIATVGHVEGGLPPVEFPWVGLQQFVNLLLPATAFALIAFADMVATVRTFARMHGYEVDANRELTALGGANLVAGVTSAFPISSSNSRSAVNNATGASSQLSVIIAAIVVGVFLLVATPAIEPLPKAALGVIIIVAAIGLIDLRGMWRLRRVRDAEVGLALSAFAGVLLFGVLGGVAVAMALSIGVFLYRAARPHDAVLAAVEGIDGYHDVERFADAQTVPGLLIYRFDAPPFFVNAEYLRHRVLEVVAASSGVDWVVMNAEAWMFLDATAVDALTQLRSDLAQMQVTLCFARLKSRQREIFDETGLTAQVGASRFFPTVQSAVTAFEGRDHAPGMPGGSI
jgi:SulP family sulfate permease